MRHAQLVIATLSLGPRPLPLRHGTLQVVDREDRGPDEEAVLDWEVVVHTIDREPVAHAVHPLVMTVITGARPGGQLTTAEVTGDALLVRAVDLAVVLRGGGPLSGFDPSLLS